ncbi:MAG: LCP family glycopolymer transferase [Frankiaceae bacterium]
MGAAGSPSTYRPAPSRRRRPSQLRRWLRRLALVLALGTLVISLGGWVIYRYYDGRIGRFHLPGGLRPAGAAGDRNYLLVGSDSRAGSDSQYQGQGQDYVTGQRSDSLILAHLDSDGTTTLISFPRDTLVTIPAFTDAAGKARAETRNRINAALDAGGPALLVQTVERLSGVRVDHYIQVDLAGFKRITDAIGGVDVCIRKAPNSDNLDDNYSGFHGHVGINHLDGAQALAFVRQRHGLPSGDLARIQRQQQFLGAVFRKASSGDTLFHPDRLLSLASSVTSSLTTDDGTSIRDLVSLAERLRGKDAAKIHFATIPVRDLSATDPETFKDSSGFWEMRGVGSVLMYDRPAMDAFFAPLRAQSEQSESPAATPAPSPTAGDGKPLSVAPAAVTVKVENGSGAPRLAREVTRGLAAQGFQVGSYGNADRHDYTDSVISYPPGSLEAARTVAAAVPGAQLREDPAAAGIVLVVGSSFTSLTQVAGPGGSAAQPSVAPPSVAPSSGPVTAPSTTSQTLSPPPVTAADRANSCTY